VVALAVTAQADAVTQTVHLVEVFLPEAVNCAEDGEALHLLQGFGIFKADFDVVGGADLFGDEIGNSELRRAESVEQRSRARAILCRNRGLTISASGRPMGKFRFTQSANWRTFHS